MNNLTHLWKVGQGCYAILDGIKRHGTIKEVFEDHLIVNLPGISDHCWYEEGFNLDTLYPENNLYSNVCAWNRAVEKYGYVN